MATITRTSIADEVFKETGVPRHVSLIIFSEILEEISQHLIKGEEVKISSFGTFSVRDKRPRVGRNPKTGVEAAISARRVLSFKPSHLVRDKVYGSFKN